MWRAWPHCTWLPSPCTKSESHPTCGKRHRGGLVRGSPLQSLPLIQGWCMLVRRFCHTTGLHLNCQLPTTQSSPSRHGVYHFSGVPGHPINGVDSNWSCWQSNVAFFHTSSPQYFFSSFSHLYDKMEQRRKDLRRKGFLLRQSEPRPISSLKHADCELGLFSIVMF